MERPRSPTPTDEQTSRDGATARRRHRDLDVLGDLTVATLTPQLDARLVEESQPVQAAARQLAAVGVEGTFPVEADPLTTFDVTPGLPVFAEPERFDPLQC